MKTIHTTLAVLLFNFLISGVFGQISSDGISIYPNPAGEKLTIDFSVPANKQIELTFSNTLGQSVLSQSFFDASNSVILDISQISEGFYFIRIIVDDKDIYNERIMIKR